MIWDGPAFTRCDGGKRGRRRERLCYDAEGLKDAIKEREGIAELIERGECEGRDIHE